MGIRAPVSAIFTTVSAKPLAIALCLIALSGCSGVRLASKPGVFTVTTEEVPRGVGLVTGGGTRGPRN
jgi:hypothetical protein